MDSNYYVDLTTGKRYKLYDKETYDLYLLSPEWKYKRHKRLEIDRFRCCMCGLAVPNMNIHHFTYHNIYRENIETDLVSLCPKCHFLVHRMMNRITDVKTNRHGWKDTISPYVQHIEEDI